MIMADSFCKSSKARSNEFSTTIDDTPLIVQFAAKDSNEFLDATKLIYPYAEGVDLNCGCPQRWAIKDGYGCALLSQPELIHKLVREIKNNVSNDFSISVKIRLHKDLKLTTELCRQLENCGITFITVHGRTPLQKSSEDVNICALKEVCKSVHIPIIANGGVTNLKDADNLFSVTNCSGVMAASGILTNPALFSGSLLTPLSCVQDWMDIAKKDRNLMTFQCFHHHLVFMLEKLLTKKQKQVFNYLNTFESVEQYLCENVLNNLSRQNLKDSSNYVSCDYPDHITMKYSKCKNCFNKYGNCICIDIVDSNKSDGKYFSAVLSNSNTCDLDFMTSNIFEETSKV